MQLQNEQNFQITELPGGIKVISEFIPYIESFSLGFWFKVGTRDEIKKHNGISHFIEHMVFKGTKKRSARRISEDIESFGGYLNAFTSKENTCYYGRGLAKHLPKTFDVIADMVQYPLFRNSDVKKELGVILDELRDIEDNPEELIFDKFEEIIFEGNSLSRPIIGTEKTISSFNSEIITDFHKKHYALPNMIISASGKVNHDELVTLTQKLIKLQSKAAKQKREAVSSKRFGEVAVSRDIAQVHCILGKKSYGYSSPERLKLNLLSTILGEGSSSRLFQSVRERNGMTYQINTFINSYHDISAFGVYLSTNKTNANKALEITEKEFDKICNIRVSDRELRRVKEYMKGSMILGLENTSNRMIRMTSNMIYHNRFIGVQEIINKIDAITADEILELARDVFKKDSLTKLTMFSKVDA